MPEESKVKLITGGSHADARGTLRFCNDFDLTQVKRFYTIANSAEQPRRGWIMHKRETKWFFPLGGVTNIYIDNGRVERVDRGGGNSHKEHKEHKDFDMPAAQEGPGDSSPDTKDSTCSTRSPRLIKLDASRPQVLEVPPDHWFLIEQDGTGEVQVFSNCSVDEFENDDFRRPL